MACTSWILGSFFPTTPIWSTVHSPQDPTEDLLSPILPPSLSYPGPSRSWTSTQINSSSRVSLQHQLRPRPPHDQPSPTPSSRARPSTIQTQVSTPPTPTASTTTTTTTRMPARPRAAPFDAAPSQPWTPQQPPSTAGGEARSRACSPPTRGDNDRGGYGMDSPRS